MTVVLRAGARRDLREIGDWIARDNPRRAESFVAELEGRVAALADMSRRDPVVARTPLGPVHKLTHRAYLIFYRVHSRSVEVLSVRHGARKTPHSANLSTSRAIPI